MDPQDRIDRICQWIGWRLFSEGEVDYWSDSDGSKIVPVISFDPFNFAEDCSTVLDEIVKNGYRWVLDSGPDHHWARIFSEKGLVEGSGESWQEAVCNAVLNHLTSQA